MSTAKTIFKVESQAPSLRLAVLIDADNAQSAVVEGLFAEIAGFGDAIVRRIYGDFTSPQSAAWKKVLNQHSIKPVQQFAYTSGKNATDGTMIIDAMDLLYTRRFDGFCLVTSDSDFTGLAVRLREEGVTVIGFGEEKTPLPFRTACHRFVLTEVLRPITAAVAPVDRGSSKAAVPSKVDATAEIQADPVATELPTDLMRQAIDQSSGDDGWAHLGTFGQYLSKLKSDFDSRVYGFKKLSDLVRARTDFFEGQERQLAGSDQKVLFVRAKPPKR